MRSIKKVSTFNIYWSLKKLTINQTQIYLIIYAKEFNPFARFEL